MYQISILLPQHCYAGSVTGFIDILLFANQLAERKGQAALFGWTLCSQQAEPVQSASGILLQADGDFSLASGADTIIVPPLAYASLKQFQARLSSETALHQQLPAWHAAGKQLLSFCTGIPLLAESGVLNERPAAISWWLTTWFRNRYPRVQLQPYATMSESPGLLCGGASTSYIELALHLVRQHGGQEIALACSRLLLTGPQHSSQAPYMTMQSFAGHDDALVLRCQYWLQDNLAAPFSLEALAGHARSSSRTVIRRFNQVLGVSPLRYLQQLRLHAARRWLEGSNLPLEQIVQQLGYSDSASFRRLFQRELHCTPAAYRKQFQPV